MQAQSTDHRERAFDVAPSYSSSPLDWCCQLSETVSGIVQASEKRIVVAGYDGRVTLIDRDSGDIVTDALARHREGRVCLAARGDVVVTGGADGHLYATHLDGPAHSSEPLFVAGGPIEALSFGSTGQLAVASGATVTLFDLDTREVVGAVRDHASTLTSLVWCDALEAWISSCYGGVHIIDSATARRARHLPYRTSVLATAALGPLLAAGLQDPVVRVWDLRDEGGTEVINLEGFRGKTSQLAWLPVEPPTLATASANAAALWTFPHGDVRATLATPLDTTGARITGLAPVGEGLVVVASSDGVLRLFDGSPAEREECDEEECDEPSTCAKAVTSTLEPIGEERVPRPLALFPDAPGRVLVACADATLRSLSVERW